MIELEVLPPPEPKWFGACYRFASGEEAREAWTTVGDLDPSGSWNIGIYRHQRVGPDPEPMLVTAVGHQHEGVRLAENVLKVLEGVETELHRDTWLTLVKRRAAVVLALNAAGEKAGRFQVEHPPGGDTL